MLRLEQLLRIFRALQTSRVPYISMNQLFYNTFNPMEIFFSRDLFADVMSVHNRNMKHARAIKIWLDKFASYVIKQFIK